MGYEESLRAGFHISFLDSVVWDVCFHCEQRYTNDEDGPSLISLGHELGMYLRRAPICTAFHGGSTGFSVFSCNFIAALIQRLGYRHEDEKKGRIFGPGREIGIFR